MRKGEGGRVDKTLVCESIEFIVIVCLSVYKRKTDNADKSGGKRGGGG